MICSFMREQMKSGRGCRRETELVKMRPFVISCALSILESLLGMKDNCLQDRPNGISLTPRNLGQVITCTLLFQFVNDWIRSISRQKMKWNLKVTVIGWSLKFGNCIWVRERQTVNFLASTSLPKMLLWIRKIRQQKTMKCGIIL